MRHGAFRGAGDDHVRAGEAHLAEEKLGAGIKALRGERPAFEPEHAVLDLGLRQLAGDLGYRGLGRLLGGLYAGAFFGGFVPAFGPEQGAVDLHFHAGRAQLLEVGGLEAGRHPCLRVPLVAQHAGGETRPGRIFAVVDIAGFGESKFAAGLALHAGALDLQWAGDQHVIPILEPDVEARLDRET